MVMIGSEIERGKVGSVIGETGTVANEGVVVGVGTARDMLAAALVLEGMNQMIVVLWKSQRRRRERRKRRMMERTTQIQRLLKPTGSEHLLV